MLICHACRKPCQDRELWFLFVATMKNNDASRKTVSQVGFVTKNDYRTADLSSVGLTGLFGWDRRGGFSTRFGRLPTGMHVCSNRGKDATLPFLREVENDSKLRYLFNMRWARLILSLRPSWKSWSFWRLAMCADIAARITSATGRSSTVATVSRASA